MKSPVQFTIKINFLIDRDNKQHQQTKHIRWFLLQLLRRVGAIHCAHLQTHLLLHSLDSQIWVNLRHSPGSPSSFLPAMIQHSAIHNSTLNTSYKLYNMFQRIYHTPYTPWKLRLLSASTSYFHFLNGKGLAEAAIIWNIFSSHTRFVFYFSSQHLPLSFLNHTYLH